jgi:hypothetical protein
VPLRFHSLVQWWLVPLLFVASMSCLAGDKEELRARYEALLPVLEDSPFGVPLHLQSEDIDGHVGSEIHAVLDHEFEAFRAALRSPAGWCELISLHPFLRACTLDAADSPADLTVYHGSRKPAPLEKARRSQYRWERQVDASDFFKVAMQSDSQLVGTSDYRLTLEAIPLDNQRVFLRVGFSFRYGTFASMLMGTYFTFMRGRPGFTVVDHTEEGEPVLVTGKVAALERNVMRFYLALQTYLEGTAQPEAERAEWRWRRWYALSTKYPRQLFDMEESVYMDRKQHDRGHTATGVGDLKGSE